MLYSYSNTTYCTVTTTLHAVPLRQHNMLYRYNNTTCCTVTATQHAVPFHVRHLLMFYSMLHFYTPTFLYTLAVPQPLFTRSQSTHTGRITNGTMAHSQSTALLGSGCTAMYLNITFQLIAVYGHHSVPSWAAVPQCCSAYRQFPAGHNLIRPPTVTHCKIQ